MNSILHGRLPVLGDLLALGLAFNVLLNGVSSQRNKLAQDRFARQGLQRTSATA